MRIHFLTASCSLLALATSPAMAQEAGESDDIAPEVDDDIIIVTATKRAQTLQETPISVSVTSSETLEAAQIRDVLDLQTVTPSLRVSQLQNSSSTTFIIRGFGNGDNNFGVEPSVGVFVDGVFRSRTIGSLGDLANVERIEVLRGPQSTLFGKNASAGVISVITKAPQFEFGGSLEASYGNFNAVVLKGDITGPISDNIAFAIDGSYNRRDGFGTIGNLGEDVNDRNRWNIRGQLLVEPTTDLKIRAMADYSRIDEVCCGVGTVIAGPTTPVLFGIGGALETDFFSDNTFQNRVPINEVDNYGGSLQVDWNKGDLSLTSITAYRKLNNFVDQDVDFTSADIVNEIRDQRVSTFTQELRVASNFDGPINFLLGGFYYDESIDQDSQLAAGTDTRLFFDLLASAGGGTIPPVPGTFSFVEAQLTAGGVPGFADGSIFAPGVLTDEVFALDNQSWSIFGTVDFEPIDGLVFTAGFNYTDDKKDFALSQQSLDPLANINLVDVGIVGGLTPFLGADAGNPAAIAAFAADPATAAIFDAVVAGALDPVQNPLLGLAPFQFQPPFLAVPNAVEPGRTRDDDFTYTLRVAYDVAPEVNVYFSYATGFKASSINLSRDSRPSPADFIAGPGGSTILAPPSAILNAGLAVPNLSSGSRVAGPEQAEVFEVGLKAQFDGMAFNIALFDQSIKDFQDFEFTGTGFVLSNAGEQSVQGFEFDTTINPSDGLALTFSLTHLDAVFDSFVGGPIGDLSGQPVGDVSTWNISTSATYTHELGSSGNRIVSRLDYSHESNVNIVNGLPAFGPIDTMREVNLVNGSVTLQLDNGLEVGVWARNLLDDRHIITIFDGVAQDGTVAGFPNQPRTYGGIVRFKF